MIYEQAEAHAQKTRDLLGLMFSEGLLNRGDHETVDALLAFFLWGMPQEKPEEAEFTAHAFDSVTAHSLLGTRHISIGRGTSVLGQLLAMKAR